MSIQDFTSILVLFIVTATCTALIMTLRKVMTTIDSVNELVAKNTQQLTTIISDVSNITTDANNIVSKVTGTVSGINKVVDNVNKQSTVDAISSAKKAFDAAKFAWGGIQFMRQRSQQKELDKLIKQARAKG